MTMATQPEGTQDYELVRQGTRMMLQGLLRDLRDDDEAKRQQALHALQGMTKKKTTQAYTALQDEFREADGFSVLVSVINSSSGPFRQESLLAVNAVDNLVLLTKNNKQNVAAAVAAGAMNQLVALIGSGDEAPISINVLKGMYVLMKGADPAPVHKAIIDAGGVSALIKMLDTVLLNAVEPDCSIWATEVATLLNELVRGNPCISSFLCNSGVVASTLKILSICKDPLCLSLGLDVLEEIVNSEDRTTIRDAMMAEGAVPALVRTMHVKGIGSKAALALAFMGEDRRHLPVLISVLETEDIACICHIAALAADAQDLDAGCCIEFIQLLIESGSLHILRCLVMARCVGVCLALPPLHATLMGQFGHDETALGGCMLLDNASTYGRLEGALATMEMLLAGSQGVRPAPFVPACCAIMRRNGKVEAVVNVVLDEAEARALAAEGDEADAVDNEVTVLLSELMGHLPAAARDEARQLAADARAQVSINNARSPATTHPPAEDGAIAGGTQRGAGFTPMDVNIKRYDSVSFLVGGREFYALGWVLEQASAKLRRLFKQADELREHDAALPGGNAAAGGGNSGPSTVRVPSVDGLSDDRMYELFTLAVEYSYTGYAAISPDNALDMWAVAACLEMWELQTHCEDVTALNLVCQPELLGGAITLACRYRYGNRLRDICVVHILDNLMDMHDSGALARFMAGGCRQKLEEGMVHVLSDRFLIASRRNYAF